MLQQDNLWALAGLPSATRVMCQTKLAHRGMDLGSPVPLNAGSHTKYRKGQALEIRTAGHTTLREAAP